MSEFKNSKSITKIVGSMAVCFSIGFIVVIVIPNFIRARYETATNACINNLRQIDAAKEQWKIENSKKDGDVVTEADIKPYFMNGDLPKCPAGGTYIIGQVGEDPKCSIGTSAWPNSHVLSGIETNNWWTDFKAAYCKLFGLKSHRGDRK